MRLPCKMSDLMRHTLLLEGLDSIMSPSRFQISVRSRLPIAPYIEAGISVVAVDHYISWAMYFDDPDGNGLEIYCDTRTQPGGRQLWHGDNAPLENETILAALAE